MLTFLNVYSPSSWDLGSTGALSLHYYYFHITKKGTWVWNDYATHPKSRSSSMMELELEIDLFHLNIVDFFVLIGILTEGKNIS